MIRPIVVFICALAILTAAAPAIAQAEKSGLDAFDAGNYGQATSDLAKALDEEKARDPNGLGTAMTMSNLAEALRAQGKLSEALPLAQRALAIKEAKLPPTDLSLALAHNNLAAVYLQMGKAADALPLFKKAAEIAKTSPGGESFYPRTLNNLGDCYKRLGRLGEAEAMFKQSLALQEQKFGPDAAQLAMALNNLATMYSEQGKIDQSEALYKRSLRILTMHLGVNHPKTIGVRRNLELMLQHAGRGEQAASAVKAATAGVKPASKPEGAERLKSVHQVGPSEAEVKEFRAAVDLCKQGKFDEAIPELTKWIQAHPDFGAAYRFRGVAYQQTHKLDKAIADYDKAIALDPKDGRSHFYRACARADSGKPIEAVADFTRALELDPNDQSSRSLRARVYLTLHREGDAATDLAQVVKAHPDDAESHLFFGVALGELGRGKEALDEFDTCLKLDPGNKKAAQMKEIMSRSMAIRSGANDPAAESAATVESAVAKAREKIQWVFIDKTGSVVLRPSSSCDFKDGLAAVYYDNGAHLGFMDKTGNIVLKPTYKGAPAVGGSGFSEGLAAVSFAMPGGEPKAGFIDRTGKIVIEPQFNTAAEFSEGMAMIRDAKGAGFINREGKIVIAPQYGRADKFEHGLSFTESGASGSIYVTTDGKVVNKSVHGKTVWIDKTGQAVPIEKVRQTLKEANDGYSEGLKAVRQEDGSGLYGFADLSGKLVIPYTFQKVEPFSDGLAAAKTADGWGFIDKGGNWVIKPQYVSASSFSEGLACVLPGDPHAEDHATHPESTLTKMLTEVLEEARRVRENSK